MFRLSRREFLIASLPWRLHAFGIARRVGRISLLTGGTEPERLEAVARFINRVQARRLIVDRWSPDRLAESGRWVDSPADVLLVETLERLVSWPAGEAWAAEARRHLVLVCVEGEGPCTCFPEPEDGHQCWPLRWRHVAAE